LTADVYHFIYGPINVGVGANIAVGRAKRDFFSASLGRNGWEFGPIPGQRGGNGPSMGGWCQEGKFQGANPF